MNQSQQYWESIYRTKDEHDLSWHQDEPTLSLKLTCELVRPDSRIIDVGGGSSVFAGRLADLGYRSVTVMDISETALKRAQTRIKDVVPSIRWLVADVAQVSDIGQYDLWHDRAVFHFFTDFGDRNRYVELATCSVVAGGYLLLATFAPEGPIKCSGLPVQRYDGTEVLKIFGHAFTLEQELRELHETPWGKSQAFTITVLKRRPDSSVEQRNIIE